MYNSGQLNKRVQVMERTRISDGVGGYEDALTPKFTVWANIHPLTGREYWSNQQTEAQVSHRIVIRYRPDINQSYVISYNGKIFDIQYFLNVEEGNRFIELHTLERRM